jgi:hypothetical protein
LDELVKEWGVEDKWTKEARLEAVREWHALPGESDILWQLEKYKLMN